MSQWQWRGRHARKANREKWLFLGSVGRESGLEGHLLERRGRAEKQGAREGVFDDQQWKRFNVTLNSNGAQKEIRARVGLS